MKEEYTIELTNQYDLQAQMYCQKEDCENPISAENDYICLKCGSKHYFEIKKV